LKAKTNEGVDAIGRGEALAAYAVASIGEAIKSASARERIRQIEKKARRTFRSSSRPRKRP
jgi:DNA-directed RNA polymerase sigma subunit (sigma70/sigma32)